MDDVLFEAPPRLPSWLRSAYPFERRMARVEDVRIHFVDHGTGPAVLLMHGNPTWGYVWRKVIPQLAGMRVIVPDLPGFGLSDKPLRPGDHSLERNVRLMGKLVDSLRVPSITLVGQDWGGPIAAGVGSRAHTAVDGLVFANTSVLRPKRPFRTKTFHQLSQIPIASDLLFRVANFPIPLLDRVQGDRRSIGRAEKRAYAWPLRHIWQRSGPLALARMVPNDETHPSVPTLDEIGAWVEHFTGPVALVWGERDPLLGKSLRKHEELLTQAKVYRTQAGHFVQEELPDVFADAITEVVRASQAPAA